MSRPMSGTFRKSAVLATLIVLAAGGATASATTTALEGGAGRAELTAFDEEASGTIFPRTPVSAAADDPTEVGDGDGIETGESAQRPIEFTGILGRYLTRHSPVPASYLDMLRAFEPEPIHLEPNDLW